MTVVRQNPRSHALTVDAVGALAVERTGAVAWMLRGAPDVLQLCRPDGGIATVDEGIGLAAPSFSADGRVLTWRHGGQGRSAPVT